MRTPAWLAGLEWSGCEQRLFGRLTHELRRTTTNHAGHLTWNHNEVQTSARSPDENEYVRESESEVEQAALQVGVGRTVGSELAL